MKYSEIVETNNSIDISYYMEEGCGIFAVAISLAHKGGQIFIISRRNGERWSRSIPEVTHVFCRHDGLDYDVKGVRTISAMAADFDINQYDLLGPFTSSDFCRKFMGKSDRKPLFGGSVEIKEAIKIIMTHPDRYGLNS